MVEKGTFDGESGILLKVPGRIIEAIGNIAIATKFIASETIKDFKSPESVSPNIQN
jgi:hypothetical protein